MKKRMAMKHLLGAGIASLLASVAFNANAAGFQLFEYNGVNAGDYGAGAAAIADDASTAFSNPAGMIRIPNQQVVFGESLVMTDIKFNGSQTWSTNNPQNPLPSFKRTGTAQGGFNKFIPSFHYVSPLSDRWAFGLSVTAPFGLITNYGNNSVVNYAATNSEVKVIDISPSFAFKTTDKLSFGAGVDVEHMDAELDGVVGVPSGAILRGLNSNAFDTRSINEGGAWGYGWHAGLLYQFTPETRVGLTYHSQVHFDLTGTSKLEGPLAGAIPNPNSPGLLSNNHLKANVTLPPFTELGIYHEINQQWSVDGSLIYTQWSYFNDVLRVQNVQGVYQALPNSLLVPQTTTVNLTNDFRNTWRVAIGANYHPVDKWIFRAGVGYDESPVKDEYRSVRLPDADRYAVALGAHYQAIKTLGVDVGWTHLFMRNAKIDLASVSGTQIATTKGDFSNHADVIGAQLTWDII